VDFIRAANDIESYLDEKKLSFKKIINNDSIIFDNIQVGDQSVIAIVPRSINIFIRVKKKKDANALNSLLDELKQKFEDIYCLTRKNNRITLFKIRIPINKNKLFIPIFGKIVKEMRKEIPPFVLGIITEEPDQFFINQYKIWKSIPPDEQSRMIEDILVLKEKHFRSTKTKKGIIKKLNKLKINLASENEGIEDKQLLKIIFGEDFTGSFEFYLIDFAALFRAIELNLIELTLTEFFENYNKGRKKY
jgi:hypothetical protein